jgi:hypothetical protein
MDLSREGLIDQFTDQIAGGDCLFGDSGSIARSSIIGSGKSNLLVIFLLPIAWMNDAVCPWSRSNF